MAASDVFRMFTKSMFRMFSYVFVCLRMFRNQLSSFNSIIVLQMFEKCVKPFIYLNCVVLSLFNVASSSQRERETETETETETERDKERDTERQRQRQRENYAELPTFILSISISFYLFCVSVVFHFDLR